MVYFLNFIEKTDHTPEEDNFKHPSPTMYIYIRL